MKTAQKPVSARGGPSRQGDAGKEKIAAQKAFVCEICGRKLEPSKKPAIQQILALFVSALQFIIFALPF